MDSQQPGAKSGLRDASSRTAAARAASAVATGPVEALAAEFVARAGRGETVDVESLAARLADPAERARLRELVEATRSVQSLLPSQARPGLVLAQRYRLVREIGSGGMGKVFEAMDSQLERRVAVKVLAAIGAESFDPEQLFMQEAVVLASLQHPNIVAVHELGSEGDITYIVMDLVQGVAASEVIVRARETLAADGALPRRGQLLADAIGLPLPAGRPSLIDADSWFRSVARLLVEVTRTIEEAHGKGVIHRDIKPHNILLRGDGTPVILDFGLAGSIDRAQGPVTRGLFGTVCYLAPEQASVGRIGTDPRTDVYQLGLLLYEFLTLERAFPGDQISMLLTHIGHGEFRRPRAIDRGIPFELEAICLKAMELDPARRYATATALREDLQRYLEGSEVPLAARGGALAAAARGGRYWIRGHKLTVAVLLALAAGALAVGITLWSAPPAADPDPVQAYRFSEADGRLLYYPAADTVRPGDILGVTVKADGPQHVYALSVFGAKDPPTFVAPMTLVRVTADSTALADHHAPYSYATQGEVVASDPDIDAANEQTWGKLVASGDSVNCTQITEASVAGSYEGLWVFTSSEAQPRLEAWMDQLAEQARTHPEHAVPLAEARASFDAAPAPTRGGTLRLSPVQKARIADSLSAAAVLGDTDWPYTDPRRTAVFFYVEH